MATTSGMSGGSGLDRINAVLGRDPNGAPNVGVRRFVVRHPVAHSSVGNDSGTPIDLSLSYAECCQSILNMSIENRPPTLKLLLKHLTPCTHHLGEAAITNVSIPF
ncbi:MAG: hypothetical protein NVS4B6_04620 [Mycobacterium sp.]